MHNLVRSMLIAVVKRHKGVRGVIKNDWNTLNPFRKVEIIEYRSAMTPRLDINKYSINSTEIDQLHEFTRAKTGFRLVSFFLQQSLNLYTSFPRFIKY